MAKHKTRNWPKIRKYKNRVGTISYLVDLTAKGKRERKFFETRKKAEKFAAEMRDARQNLGRTAFLLDEGEKYEAATQSKRLREVGSSFTKAVDFYLKHVHPHGGKILVGEGVEKWLQAKSDSGRRAEYLRTQGIVLRNFARDHDGRYVHELGTADVESWLRNKTAREKWSPRTRWNYRRDLKSFWKWCVNQGFAALNPIERIEAPTLDDSPPGILTPTQAKSLLLEATKAQGNAMVPYIAIGLFAGLRSAEIERLDWSEVDLRAKLIEVKGIKAKTRQRRHVAIAGNLRAWLVPYKKEAGPVAPRMARIDLQLTGLAKKAGIKPWPKNALRHSFASYHMAQHKDPARTALELGHHNQEMLFRNYRQLVKPATAQIYWKTYPSFDTQHKA